MCGHSARTAIVTGAAQGIGRSIAQRLAVEGARVAIVDVQAGLVEAAATELRAGGAQALAFTADVSSEQEVMAVVAEAREQWGGVDILVNNAGISPKHGGKKALVEEMDIAEWRRVLDVNLTSVFLFSRAVLPLMRERRWGRIVNISSQAGRTGAVIAAAHYAASKAGIIGFSRTLALEVGHYGITVNCVAPGRIVTPMMAGSLEETNRAFLEATPVRRFGSPDEIAAAVSFLGSEEAGFITGTVLDVNGGRFMG